MQQVRPVLTGLRMAGGYEGFSARHRLVRDQAITEARLFTAVTKH